ncbi:hypothetical protein HYC85_025228 [Camellia sinensis]|uniref:Retrotransposon gag domain-containing protein n=1 Tax=Camellia sinensis TaxID=4442 RepID=A0A7J7GAE3_CAMSI|nr:hypothetical protein HYC85_025228 [Camellia sinensis]
MNSQDKLDTIEELTICGMENLMEIWPEELEARLRKMNVKLSNGLSSILFPSNSIKGMQNLKVVEVEDCQSIGVAFDLEGLVWEDGISDMALPLLKKVELCHRRKLTHVWKDNSPGIQGSQNLRSLIVNDCDCLRNLFSYSLAKLLVKLREIEVTECDMMESIIGNEPNADDAVITNMIILKLSDLPNLSSFCSEACTFKGSLLKTIEVINCPKIKILPSAFQRKLEQQKADFSTSSQLHLLDGKTTSRHTELPRSSDLQTVLEERARWKKDTRARDPRRVSALQRLAPKTHGSVKTDPYMHLSHFRQVMVVYRRNEALMYILFPSSLGDLGLTWFERLPEGSIASWAQLAEVFVTRFRTNTKTPVEINQPLSIDMGEKETLRSSNSRYWEAFNQIGDCPTNLAIA